MKTKNIISLAVLAVTALGALVAPVLAEGNAGIPVQQTAKVHEGHHAKMAKLAEKLDLSQNQITQIKAIRKSARTRVKALRSDSTLSETDKKAQRKEIRHDVRTQMMNVLTMDQKEKLKALRAEHREKQNDKDQK